MLITIDNVLSKDEVHQFRQRLDTCDWQGGSATAGSLATHVKRNQQVADGSPLAVELGNHVLRAVAKSPLFISAALPRKIYPPKFNRYADGGTYGAHVDSAVMHSKADSCWVRSDLSCTLFLTPPQDYDGGELLISEGLDEKRIKLPAGDLVLYPSSTVHQVTPVTRGHRISSFFWIESMVRGLEQRQLLFNMDMALLRLRQTVGETDASVITLSGTYHNLLRMWADV